jgi:hypothetical protein
MAAAKNRDAGDETSVARNDAYTGMLVISLLALLTGAVLLFLDYNQYPDKKPPQVPKGSIEAPVAPGAGGQGGAAPAAPANPNPPAAK